MENDGVGNRRNPLSQSCGRGVSMSTLTTIAWVALYPTSCRERRRGRLADQTEM